MRKFILLTSIITVYISCNTKEQGSQTTSAPESKPPKNIILLIGDGMGLTQVSSLYAFENKKTSFDRFPVVGLIKTASSNRRITDSAAGATAFASGIKSYNAAIGVDPDTAIAETIVEVLSKDGWKTGLVATSSITHATPAAFYAHVQHRNMEEEIARQLVYAPVDIFIGGGMKFFANRKDGINYLDSLQHYGYRISTNFNDKPGLEKTASPKEGFLLAENGMAKRSEGRGSFLKEASNYTIQQLSETSNPFFIMIEGSQIDWGGHENDHEYIVNEMLDFEETIGAVLDFAKKDGNTLVVVTADHETGGYALSGSKEGRNGVTGTFSTGSHTAALIPVFAFGPGSEKFAGIYENNDIYHKMLKLVGKE